MTQQPGEPSAQLADAEHAAVVDYLVRAGWSAEPRPPQEPFEFWVSPSGQRVAVAVPEMWTDLVADLAVAAIAEADHVTHGEITGHW